MSRHRAVLLILVAGLLPASTAAGQRLGGDPRGLKPSDARRAVRALAGGAVGGRQHVVRVRAWERRGRFLKTTAVWNALGTSGSLAVSRSGSTRGGKGPFTAQHYVSVDPQRRAASYQIEHRGSRTHRHLLRQSSALRLAPGQIAGVLGVEPGSLGPALSSYAIQETRLTHDRPVGPPGKQTQIQVQHSKYHLTTPAGQRITSLSESQVQSLNMLQHDIRQR